MMWDVRLYVGGKVFTESVRAVDRDDALVTAKARNPTAKVIGVNPTLNNEKLICLDGEIQSTDNR